MLQFSTLEIERSELNVLYTFPGISSCMEYIYTIHVRMWQTGEAISTLTVMLHNHDNMHINDAWIYSYTDYISSYTISFRSIPRFSICFSAHVALKSKRARPSGDYNNIIVIRWFSSTYGICWWYTLNNWGSFTRENNCYFTAAPCRCNPPLPET